MTTTREDKIQNIRAVLAAGGKIIETLDDTEYLFMMGVHHEAGDLVDVDGRRVYATRIMYGDDHVQCHIIDEADVDPRSMLGRCRSCGGYVRTVCDQCGSLFSA